MKMSDWGETGLISQLKQIFTTPPNVVGIGDDCAVLPQCRDTVWLVTTDAVVEGVHFIRGLTSAEDLGYKSIAVNLSDVAAMGGRPRYCLVAASLPTCLEKDWIQRLIMGIKEAVDEAHVVVVGGNTTRSPQYISITITMMGEAPAHHVKLRKSAKPGDIVCVTGTLGDAAAGLRLLNQKEERPSTKLLKAQTRPKAHVKEGAWLGNHSGVHAMIDLSDGLYTDLTHICEASLCGAQVYVETLPVSPDFREACQHSHWDATQLAVSGGEDYCLLCTIDPKEIDTLSHAYSQEFHRPLHRIGFVTNDKQAVTFYNQGQPVPVSPLPFSHF